LMLGTAFLLWGIVQLMPASNLTAELGNVVIALYVVDLGLIIWSDLERSQPRMAGWSHSIEFGEGANSNSAVWTISGESNEVLGESIPQRNLSAPAIV
jgi:hypothetical protein